MPERSALSLPLPFPSLKSHFLSILVKAWNGLIILCDKERLLNSSHLHMQATYCRFTLNTHTHLTQVQPCLLWRCSVCVCVCVCVMQRYLLYLLSYLPPLFEYFLAFPSLLLSVITCYCDFFFSTATPQGSRKKIPTLYSSSPWNCYLVSAMQVRHFA